MEKITLGDKSFVPYIAYTRINDAIDNVAAKLNADFKYSDQQPVLLCILSGAIMFCSELMKRLEFNCTLATLKVSSYSGTQSTGIVRAVTPIPTDLQGKTVIIVEDIVDSGRTVNAVTKMIEDAGAAKVLVCTMLLKPEVYKNPEKPAYVGLEIGDRFIVGFGLDYNELGRNLKDIYVLE